jgi:hypothetical protein
MNKCTEEQIEYFKYKINGACIRGDGDEDFEDKISFLLIFVSLGFLLTIWLFIRKTNRILLKMTTPNLNVPWDETYCIFTKWSVLTIWASLYAAAIGIVIFAVQLASLDKYTTTLGQVDYYLCKE